MPHISIIGGGAGGLATALWLRRAGFSTAILEKNSSLGGKLSSYARDGFSFDLGPTVLTMPFVAREIFDAFGRSLDDYLDLAAIDPTCRYHWLDGTRFEAFSDPAARRREVQRLFPEDLEAFERFLVRAGRLYDATKEIFLLSPFDGFLELVKPKNVRMLGSLPNFGLWQTVERSVSSRITSPKLAQMLLRFATYAGSSPYKAPATLNVIPYVEIVGGAWYPVGGMARITAALERLARQEGVAIETGANVQRIERQGNRVTTIGVNGESRKTDAVVSNVDALWTYRSLLEPIGIRIPPSVRNAERSCSGFLIMAAVRGKSDLAHHNIFFSDDYPGEFHDIFDRRILPRDMTIYVSISSKTDPNLAPPGHENWYILVNAPSSGIEHGNAEAHARYADAVWGRLRRFGVSPDVLWQQLLTPEDIELRDNSIGGAIYGAASNSMLSAFLRPRNKLKPLENMYLAGGSAHPGGGVPLVLLSGRITATVIARDFGRG